MFKTSLQPVSIHLTRLDHIAAFDVAGETAGALGPHVDPQIGAGVDARAESARGLYAAADPAGQGEKIAGAARQGEINRRRALAHQAGRDAEVAREAAAERGLGIVAGHFADLGDLEPALAQHAGGVFHAALGDDFRAIGELLSKTEKIILFGEGAATGLTRDMTGSLMQTFEAMKASVGLDIPKLIRDVASGGLVGRAPQAEAPPAEASAT